MSFHLVLSWLIHTSFSLLSQELSLASLQLSDSFSGAKLLPVFFLCSVSSMCPDPTFLWLSLPCSPSQSSRFSHWTGLGEGVEASSSPLQNTAELLHASNFRFWQGRGQERELWRSASPQYLLSTSTMCWSDPQRQPWSQEGPDCPRKEGWVRKAELGSSPAPAYTSPNLAQKV